MAVFTISVDPELPNQEFNVSLDGALYVLRFKWNEREQAWYMSILDEAESPIFEGVKVVLDTLLGVRTSDPRGFPGALVAFDSTGQLLMPGEKDLGSRVVLFYYDFNELAELNA